MRLLMLALASVAAVPASAQVAAELLLLSDSYGRPMTIGAQADMRETLSPTEMTGVAAAESFAGLCLSADFSSAGLDTAAAASNLGLKAQEAALPPAGKNPAVRQPRWVSPSAVATFWNGDDTGMKGRPIVIRSRGALVMGPYGPFKALGTQCNLSLALAGVADLQSLADRLIALTSGTSEKIVVKPTWADGSIKLPDGRRVTFAVVNADKPISLLHFTVQKIEGAKP